MVPGMSVSSFGQVKVFRYMLDFHIYIDVFYNYCKPLPGDEANALNESWMCLTFTSLCSKLRSFSRASRFLITAIPTCAYQKDGNGVNITLQEAAKFITSGFERLSRGFRVSDLPSLGGHEAAGTVQYSSLLFRMLHNLPVVFIGL